MAPIRIRQAVAADTPVILELIRALAEFEKLSHEVSASAETLCATLFDKKPAAEVLLAEIKGSEGAYRNCGFALFFTSYSTFLAKPGLYLEDLFVRPEDRSHGIGQMLLAELAKIAVSRDYGRMEWSVLNWNKRAWAFYARMNAKPMDDWTVHRLTGDALLALAHSGNQ